MLVGVGNTDTRETVDRIVGKMTALLCMASRKSCTEVKKSCTSTSAVCSV